MKPILVGLNNPYSANPDNALAAFPVGSAGHRLWSTMSAVDFSCLSVDAFNASVHQGVYMDAFDRRNLFGPHIPDTPSARQAEARGMLPTFPVGSTVVLLGADVMRSFSPVLERPLEKFLIHPQVRDGRTWRLLPHPSGRVTQYNDPVFRMLVGMVLAGLITKHSTGDLECQEVE